MNQPTLYLTNAIDYVNAVPHLGTAYEKIGTDIWARYLRLLGHDVHVLIGSDEHSAKVEKAAAAQNLDPQSYCNQMRDKFETAWKTLSIEPSQYVQTSDDKHHKSVQTIFQKIYDRGYIYEAEYEGLYDEITESFITEKELVDGRCPESGSIPKRVCEKNYFFKLSAFTQPLLDFFQKEPHFLLPESRRNEILRLLEGGLKDLSVSRRGTHWGVAVPWDPQQRIYVWFDALINYVSFAGFSDDSSMFHKLWPAHCHVVGKDITRFHCVIWPAMLMAAELPLPKRIFGHGFIYFKGQKMSKSLGNVVNPLELAQRFGADALRYVLFRGSAFGQDGDFSLEDFETRYTSDLANGLGNLVRRNAGMIQKYFGGQLNIPALDEQETMLADRITEALALIRHEIDPDQTGDLAFNRILEWIWKWIGDLDRYIDQQAPWTLAKEKRTDELTRVLGVVSLAIHGIHQLIAPIMPDTSQKIAASYGFSSSTQILIVEKPQSVRITDVGPLFPRLEETL